MNRLQLRCGFVAIETENNSTGRAYLECLRKTRPKLFGRGRIRSILQLGLMPTGIVYIVNGPTLAEPWRVNDNPIGGVA